MSEKTSVRNENYSEITALHVLGTVMILLCHFFQEVKLYMLGEIFISGVPLFLIVSGYLAGLKKQNTSEWVLRRVKRILIPYYMWIVFVITIYFIADENMVSIKQVLFLVTNFQGLNYIWWKSDYYSAICGLGHLWYVTVIMVCVFLTPYLRKVCEKIKLSKQSAIVIMLIMVFIVQPLGVLLGVQFSYIFTYVVGFFIAKYSLKVSKLKYGIITLLFIVVTVIRLFARNFIDGLILYDRYIALISATMLALWIFYTIFMIKNVIPPIFDKLINSRVVQLFAGISYEIYLTHYFFLLGAWNFGKYIKNPIVSDIFVLLATLLTAQILSVLSKKIITYKWNKRRK